MLCFRVPAKTLLAVWYPGGNIVFWACPLLTPLWKQANGLLSSLLDRGVSLNPLTHLLGLIRSTTARLPQLVYVQLPFWKPRGALYQADTHCWVKKILGAESLAERCYLNRLHKLINRDVAHVGPR